MGILESSTETSERRDLEVPKHHGDVMIAEPKARTKRPPFFKVLLLNDDYTPMDFVVQVLQSIFRKNHEEALATMMEVHNRGAGVCGIFTRDVAETKADHVVMLARQHEYPLQCRVEQD
jgi:ATP-dependent Clp protease adaptor protein ClpS